jgi:hypothetical protein
MMIVLFVGLGCTSAGAAPADAGLDSTEVQEYRNYFEVSADQAAENLATQATAAEADLAGVLEARLESHYAGVWFDNDSGELVVSTLPSTSRSEVEAPISAAGLQPDDFRVAVVNSSWSELESVQAQIGVELRSAMERGLVRMWLDARENVVVVELAQGAMPALVERAERLATVFPGRTEIRSATTPSFDPKPLACRAALLEKYCDLPMRGGVAMNVNGDWLYRCTAGFPARGISDGRRYVLTAGHCGPVENWASMDGGVDIIHQSTEEIDSHLHYLGKLQQITWPGHDWAKIDATGSYWDQTPWPTRVAYWGEYDGTVVHENYEIEGEAKGVQGQFVCHSGATTGTTCGELVATDYDVYYDGNGVWVNDLGVVVGGCAGPGDSGGSVFAGHMALGLLSGGEYDEGDPEVEGDEHYCHEAEWDYSEIGNVTQALGVRILPRIDDSATQTTIESATALNGNPGWFSIKGKVKALGGASVNNAKVKVKLLKVENGQWVQKAELEATVNSGVYEINNWNGVGPGEWIAKVVFPAQNGLGESSSAEGLEGGFLVKDGYRIVSKNSGKCLDVYYVSKENGASVKQQYCADPTIFQNQVFTLQPLGNGYLRIVPRHSGGCLEIAVASQYNGALLQQWGCNGSSQQSWQTSFVENAGGAEYIKLIPKHSGKCLDVLGGSTADGASVGQWDCNTTAQQKWTLQSVNSGPVATEVTQTVPESERLNGQPGYASVHGYVKTGYYGIPAGDNWVNVNYEQEVSPGNFSLIKTNHPTLNSEGFYEYKYEGLGAGNWRIWTGFPGSTKAAPALAASQSAKVNIHLGTGYRFKFRHSEKCLSLLGNYATSGTPFVQWSCYANPNPNDGQVFTMVPKGDGYYNLVVNSSGKCVDVTEWSQTPATQIKEYPCGAAQTNQLWYPTPISGQAPWNAFIVKHSGQCLDNYASGTANGTNAVQWPCNWGASEQWVYQGIG